MGMSGDTALALAKSYVKKTLQGQGALKGQDGFSPTITENADNTDKIYKLDITTANSAFTTPNLRGKDGEGTGSGEENNIDSISVNGVNVLPDVNKNVDITVPSIEGLTKDADLATVAKSGNYEDLANKPIIPSLDGYAKTSEIPSKVSELENDNKYQTESDVTTTLANYATKTYVGEQIANAEHLKREIVTALPSDTEASDNIIYMLKVESATGNDKYQEYMKIDGTVQMVGDTSVDLTDYAKTTEIPTTVAELTDSADYAKTADIPTTLPANGGNADTVNNHTVKSDVPENAVFTDTVYDDTEVKESISAQSTEILDIKMLGWSVPKECPIQNEVNGNQFVQKVGRVDLGSLGYANSEAYGVYTYDIKNKIKVHIVAETASNIYCRDYLTVSWDNLTNQGKVDTNYIASSGDGAIGFNTTLSAEQFQSKMQGQYLYYELATPITKTIDGNEAIEQINESLSNKTKLTFEFGDIKWSDGSNIDSATWKRSGFIKVTPNTKYTLNRTQTEHMNIIGYKEDKTVITDGTTVTEETSAIIKGCKTAEYEFTTTPTTNYIRIAITDTNLSENITLTNNGIGNTVVELVEDVDEIKNDLEALKNAIIAMGGTV